MNFKRFIREADGNFVRKDIVMLRISHMDYDSFKFWRSVERNQSTNGNRTPSSSSNLPDLAKETA